jgi:hypothetical protein
MANRKCSTGLDNRCRNEDGRIRAKNGNTRVDTLREIYGPDFAKGIRGDAHLSTVFERTGTESLSDYRRGNE